MKATVLDLRRNTSKILEALARNETVSLSKRGKEIARIVPTQADQPKGSIKDNPAVGMWADRQDMEDPAEYVRKLRRGRYRDI